MRPLRLGLPCCCSDRRRLRRSSPPTCAAGATRCARATLSSRASRRRPLERLERPAVRPGASRSSVSRPARVSAGRQELRRRRGGRKRGRQRLLRIASAGSARRVLANLAQGPNRRLDSEAENLLGILAFTDSQQHGPSAPAPVDRSVADFQAAVELDPQTGREVQPRAAPAGAARAGVRPGSNGASSGPAKGHQGAGGGLPGQGTEWSPRSSS